MIIYGHRGAKGEAPENTLEGFRHAYRYGIRHYELDLVLSKDGECMLVHDLTLDRTTGKKGRVCDLTAADLAKLDTRHYTKPWPGHAGIPKLTQLLDELPDLEHVQLEVKSDRRSQLNVLANRLTELIQHRQMYSRVSITSADTWFLRQIHRRNRNISLGLVTDKRFPKPAKLAERLHCDYLCIGWRLLSRELVEEAHERGLSVSAWTVNRIHDMLALEAMGVDSVISDYPTSARIFFDNRPAHHLRLGENSLDSEQKLLTTGSSD